MRKLQVFLKGNIFYFIILLVGVGYILSGMSGIVQSQQTLDTIISTSAITSILGWLISALFGQQAIKDGYNDPDFINALNEQGKASEEVRDDTERLSIYCDKTNESTMIRKRTRILKKVGIKYEQFESGNFGGLVMTKQRKRAIKKASNIGFGYLTPDWLLADVDEEEERNERPVSVKKYTLKKNAWGAISKALSLGISGWYILEPFVNANWNILIWRTFFFTLMLIFGYVRYVGDMNFMTRDYRNTIVNKTKHLNMFRQSLVNHPEWYIKKVEVVEPLLEKVNEQIPSEEKIIAPQREQEENELMKNPLQVLMQKGVAINE